MSRLGVSKRGNQLRLVPGPDLCDKSTAFEHVRFELENPLISFDASHQHHVQTNGPAILHT